MRIGKGHRRAAGRVPEVSVVLSVAAALCLAPSAFAGDTAAATPDARAAQAPEDTSGVNEYTEPGIPGGPAEGTAGSAEEGAPASGGRPQSGGRGSKSSQRTAGTAATGSQGQAADDDSATDAPGAEESRTGRETTLPRTGIDVWFLVMTGLALLGSGVLLRRLEAARTPGLSRFSHRTRGEYLTPAGPQAGFRTKSK
jgi:LPXTG-motif cell wall-anchored protein